LSEEPVEQESPSGVCECLEDEVVVSHRERIGDQIVTCQAGVTVFDAPAPGD
jgi:hypothetical protein